MKPLLTCDHVDFGYDHHEVVRNLNLELYPGDYVCVIGENGSGKSTLVKGLLGLLKPTSGALILSEELKQGGIGYLPQQTEAQKDFPATVLEVVLSGTLSRRGNRPFYSFKEKEVAAFHMKRMGIEHMKHKCYRELSGGQKQRARIARALCATEHMLILDEPTTGLAPSAIADFYQTIRSLNQEQHITIVMVTHDIHNGISQGRQILHMGEDILFYENPEDYRKSPVGMEFLGGE